MSHRCTDTRIPHGVIERLPSYLNVLIHLREEGSQTVSSARLSEIAEVNAAQIRRDLAYFGQFGKRGVGYDIAAARRPHPAHPRLGPHPAPRDRRRRQPRFGDRAVRRACARAASSSPALFDSDPRKVGTRVGDLIVRDIGELERVVGEQAIRFGVIAVPAEAAQHVADRLCASGIQRDRELLDRLRERSRRRDAAQHRSRARTAPHAVLPVARGRRGERIRLVVRYSLAFTRPTGIGRSRSYMEAHV